MLFAFSAWNSGAIVLAENVVEFATRLEPAPVTVKFVPSVLNLTLGAVSPNVID